MNSKITIAYKRGYDDYFAGSGKEDNPYETGSSDHNLWLTGYKAGEKEDVDHDPDGN